MTDPESPESRRSLDPEVQVAAAAITAAISPLLGIAVAAGSALRSRRVREALRKGTVRTLAGAMELGDQMVAAAARAGSAEPEPATTDAVTNGHSSAAAPKH
jgi:hypothetical protein